MRACLIDLSGLYRRHYHATEHEDISEAVKRTLKDVMAYSTGFNAVGIAVDRPPYFRSKIDPNYKAHREKTPEVVREQLRFIEEQLLDDGYHLFGAESFEADDVIATLTKWLGELGSEVSIYSSDKDLLQLVSGKVSCISIATGQKFGPAEVLEKFGIPPAQVGDLLALMGDKSDGIPGIKGCGPKTASTWIHEWANLDGVLANADKLEPARFREVVAGSRDVIKRSRVLAALRFDVPIECAKIGEPMVRREKASEPTIDLSEEEPMATVTKEGVTFEETTGEVIEMPMPQQAMVKAPVATQVAPPPGWDKALEPRDMKQAYGLACSLHKSRMFGDFPNPEAILAIVMTGRNLGMDSVTSLRGFHFIKGKASPSAQLLVGLVKRHPTCEYFRFVRGDAKSATWETKRRDEPEPTSLTYTIEEAQLAGLAGNDQWRKRAPVMLRWRAGTELARLVYPDVTTGMYTPEELAEG